MSRLGTEKAAFFLTFRAFLSALPQKAHNGQALASELHEEAGEAQYMEVHHLNVPHKQGTTLVAYPS